MYIYIQATRRYRCDVNSELYVRSSRCIFGSARFRKRFEVPIPKFLFSRKYRNFRALLKTKSALKTHFQKTKNAPDCNELLKYCEYRFHKHCSKAALCYVLYLLYPYITYPSTFRSLNLHLNSTSTSTGFQCSSNFTVK